MKPNKYPIGPFGPILTAAGAAALSGERIHNGWIKKQGIYLQQNSFKLQEKQFEMDREKAKQQAAIEKAVEKRQILSSVNKKLLTPEQGHGLIQDLENSNSTPFKPTSISQSFLMPNAPSLHFLKNENNQKSEQQLVPPTFVLFDSKNQLEILEKNKENYFQESCSETNNSELIQLDPYPTGQIVVFSIGGGIAGFLFYFVIIFIMNKIEFYLNKRS